MSELLSHLLTLGVVFAVAAIGAIVAAAATSACVAVAAMLLGMQVAVRVRVGLDPIPAHSRLGKFLEAYVAGREQTVAAARQQGRRTDSPPATAAPAPVNGAVPGKEQEQDAAPDEKKGRYF